MARVSKHILKRLSHSLQIPQPHTWRLTALNILPFLRALARDHAAIVGFSSRAQVHAWILGLATRQRLVGIRPEDIFQALTAERIVSLDEASGIFFVDGKRARHWARVLTSPITISDRVPRRRQASADDKPCILAADRLYAGLRIDPS